MQHADQEMIYGWNKKTPVKVSDILKRSYQAEIWNFYRWQYAYTKSFCDSNEGGQYFTVVRYFANVMLLYSELLSFGVSISSCPILLSGQICHMSVMTFQIIGNSNVHHTACSDKFFFHNLWIRQQTRAFWFSNQWLFFATFDINGLLQKFLFQIATLFWGCWWWRLQWRCLWWWAAICSKLKLIESVSMLAS